MGIWSRLREATGVLVGGMPRGEASRMVSGVLSSSSPPMLGIKERLESYETMPWVRAVAGRTAEAVAGTQWVLYARRGGAGKFIRDVQLQAAGQAARRMSIGRLKAAGEVVEVEPEHPLFQAMANPNGFITGRDVIMLTQLCVDLGGDAFLLKERNALGVVTGLWPIPPHWIRELPTPSKPQYAVSWRGWHGSVPDSEIVWVHNPAPANPYTRGTSITGALADEIQVDEYVAKFANSLFFNRMTPDFVAQVYEQGQGGEVVGVSGPELERIEAKWAEKNQGFYKAFKAMFINRKIDIHEFQKPTMEQLIYPGLRNVERDIILQTWGMPPEQLGIVESSNRATAEVSNYIFESRVVQPRREALRAQLQAKLAPEYDDRLIVDYVDTTPADKEHRLNVMKAAPWAFSQEEWHEEVGSDDGDEVYMVPLNSYATTDLLDPAQRPQAAAGGRPPAEEEEEDKPEPVVVNNHFTLPEIKQGDVHITNQPPEVHVAAPEVTVTSPPITFAEGAIRAETHIHQAASKKQTVIRDEQGRIVGSETSES